MYKKSEYKGYENIMQDTNLQCHEGMVDIFDYTKTTNSYSLLPI